MPGRGRPPIVRTKEEALTARRDQVRMNVQAYRRRKETSSGAGASQNVKLKDLTFVLEDLGQSKNQDRAPDAVRATQDHALKAVECNNDGNLPSTTICETVPQRPKTNSHPHYRSHDDSFLALVPQEISAAQVSRQQLASNAASTFSSTLQDQSTGPHWSQIIPDLVNRNVILDFSIQALCLMQVSHVNDERWLLQRSLYFYDKALKALQWALAQARDGFRLELFAATMALGTYELLQGTNAQGRGWQYHIKGATAYLNMFPSLNVSAFSSQLSFHFLETICIFDALGSRKPSCFSTTQWWRDSVDRFGGEPYGALLRMLTSLPSVLEQCDAAASLPPSTDAVEEWTRLLQLCLRLEDAFLDWFRRVLSDESSRCSPSATATTPGSTFCGPLQITDPEASFPNLYTARLYLLYWPSMILLYESITTLISNLNPWPPSSPFDPITIPLNSIDAIIFPQAYTSTSHTFATSILDSVPFCLHPSYGIVGKSLVLLPLFIAGNYFRHDGNKQSARRCEDVLAGLGQGKMKFGLKVKKGL